MSASPLSQRDTTLIDFSGRDGRKRLAEIRAAVDRGEFKEWIELVFLPLYGKATGAERSRFVEEVLRFETALFHAEKMSARLLAATLILSNKLVEREVLDDLWEEIKMLDILELAREKGLKEGLEEGRKEGLTEGQVLGVRTSQDMVMDALLERFSVGASDILEEIRNIRSLDQLRVLLRQALKCKDLAEFEAVLRQITA